MAALDLLGRRWALRLLWELRSGPTGARALREQCDDMSSSVLYERLSELHAAGLIAKNDSGDYALTPLGADLGTALDPLDQWARRWAKQRNALRAKEFWSLLGWQSTPRHVNAAVIPFTNGMNLVLHEPEFAHLWDSACAGPAAGSTVVDVSVSSREAVDDTHARIVAAGFTSSVEPWDTFFRSRTRSCAMQTDIGLALKPAGLIAFLPARPVRGALTHDSACRRTVDSNVEHLLRGEDAQYRTLRRTESQALVLGGHSGSAQAEHPIITVAISGRIEREGALIGAVRRSS